MSALYVQHHSGILAEFLDLLEHRWSYQVACQNECDVDEGCDCIRHIVHVQAVVEWWTTKTPDFLTHTRLQRLLEDFKLLGPRSLIVEQGLISGSRAYILVFSMLLELGYGHLLGRFIDSGIDDRSLASMQERDEQVLRKSLSECGSSIQVEQVIDDFQRARWAYCPLTLSLGMEDDLRGTKTIPPFCQKLRLGHTGGTASLYWIAVQQELITDNKLASALRDSIYADEIYGECYQMVLKSYSGKRRSEFEIEKTAFLYLSSSELVPIIKFLGSYTHSYGEGKEMGETYNLLLEFGERDLYETWADETNVPPVRAEEILQSWKSLFEVAKAIRHIHNLEIRRGKSLPWRYHGWHADIKPDNILVVRGQLKLADFGFSSFAPVVERRDDSEPTEFIRGYTDTYGAPEVFRMNKPSGTLSGVSQAIDTWSFGCVLSVAATWLVLGYQGVRQYEKLRQLSPENDKGNVVLDRFHDGFDVLPEVEKWHNFLRGHLRISDTATELVLDLIETKLLRANPAARYNMEELCDKLQELSAWAEHKIKSLRKQSRHTDALVARALMDVEALAEMERSSERNLNLSQRSFVHIKSLEPVSKRADNKDLIRIKPLGQTAHRKQILDTMLEEHSIIERDDAPDASGIHNGAITDSPIDSVSPMELQYHGRKAKPVNPQLRAPDQGQQSRRHDTPNTSNQHVISSLLNIPPPYSRQRRTFDATSPSHSDDSFAGRPGLHVTIPYSPLVRYPARRAQSNDTLKQPPPSEDERTMVHDPESSSVSTSEKTADAAKPHAQMTEQSTINRRLEDQNSFAPNHLIYHQRGDLSGTTSTSLMQSAVDHKRIQEPTIEAADMSAHTPEIVPSITLSQSENTESSQNQLAVSQSSSHAHEKQLAEESPNPHAYNSSGYNSPLLLTLPTTVLSLPYDICLRRKDLDEKVTKGLAKGVARLKGSFGIETRTRDSSLIWTFGDPRELIFVVDNGWTMSKHWPIVIFVAETLAKNAAGLDRSGFDVKFTVDGHTHNQERLKGDLGRKKLKKALRAAWPEYKENNHVTTDMARVFNDISQDWHRGGQPATTLLVFTDGVWSNTNLDSLNKIILDIAEKDRSHVGNRHFSIQFIRFGDEEAQKTLLQTLDDCLCVAHNLRDIIDHCSWRAKVDKMFKGSIEGYFDEQDPDEEPILYDYKKLVDLFNTFNRAEDPTRISHRSSTSLSNKGGFARR